MVDFFPARIIPNSLANPEDIMVNIWLKIWGWGTASLMKCLSHKPEYISLIPRTHIKMWVPLLYVYPHARAVETVGSRRSPGHLPPTWCVSDQWDALFHRERKDWRCSWGTVPWALHTCAYLHIGEQASHTHTCYIHTKVFFLGTTLGKLVHTAVLLRVLVGFKTERIRAGRVTPSGKYLSRKHGDQSSDP